MKVNNIFLWCILLLFLLSITHAQNISSKEKCYYLGLLDSTWVNGWSGIHDIVKYNIREAIPILEKKIWSQEYLLMKWEYLNALWKLHAPNISILAKTFMDSIPIYASNPYDVSTIDTLSWQIQANEILFENNDYSYADLLLQSNGRDSAHFDINAQILLPKIIENVPSLADRAKSQLIKILHNVTFWVQRSRALDDLVELYGDEMSDVVLNVAVNDKDPTIREAGIQYLAQMGYPELHQFIIQQLTSDSSWALRTEYADSLLYRYGTIDVNFPRIFGQREKRVYLLNRKVQNGRTSQETETKNI